MSREYRPSFCLVSAGGRGEGKKEKKESREEKKERGLGREGRERPL